jgi:hypothetical protein
MAADGEDMYRSGVASLDRYLSGHSTQRPEMLKVVRCSDLKPNIALLCGPKAIFRYPPSHRMITIGAVATKEVDASPIVAAPIVYKGPESSIFEDLKVNNSPRALSSTHQRFGCCSYHYCLCGLMISQKHGRKGPEWAVPSLHSQTLSHTNAEIPMYFLRCLE